MTRNYRRGQVGLMLLVVMGLVISIVLSVASRSLSDITLSRQERENSSTFAIAESGVEQALKSLSEGAPTGGNVADMAGLVTGNYSVAAQQIFDMYVKEGESAQIDLTGATGNVTVEWVKGNENPETCAEGSGNAPAALEIALFSGSDTVSRAYYNARGCTLASNGFSNTAVAGSDGYGSRVDLAVGSNVAMRLKPFYNGTTIRVAGTNFASQLYLIQAKAQGGDARTDIEARRGLDSAGSVFDYALFSGTTIIK